MTEQTASRVPQIRFKGFEGEWAQKMLGDIFAIGDADHWMPETTSRGIPYVMTGDFFGINEIDFKNAKLISQLDFEKLSKKIKPELGDILFARYASIGSVRYVNTTRKFIASYSCAILKSNNSFNSEYLFYLIQTDKIQNQLKQSINTGSQGNIGIESLKNLATLFPEKTEQNKTAAFFSKVNEMLGLHQGKHDKLVTLKKAMLQKMFPQAGATTPEIRFKGFSMPWDLVEMEKLGHTYGGLFGKTKDNFGRGDARYVTYMGVFSHAVSNLKMTGLIGIDQTQNQVKKGDVLFTISSETPNEVGMSSVWSEDVANVYLNSFCFGFRPITGFHSDFLAHVFRADEFRKNISFLAQGISRYNISKTKVMKIPVRIPALEEQQKIGTYFRQLDELISKHAIQLQKLKQLKSACLEKMFV